MGVLLAFKKPVMRNWAPSQAGSWLMFFGFVAIPRAGFFLAVFGFILAEHGNVLHWMDARNPVPNMGLPFQGEDGTPCSVRLRGKAWPSCTPYVNSLEASSQNLSSSDAVVTLKCWEAFCTFTNCSLTASSFCYLDYFQASWRRAELVALASIAGSCAAVWVNPTGKVLPCHSAFICNNEGDMKTHLLTGWDSAKTLFLDPKRWDTLLVNHNEVAAHQQSCASFTWMHCEPQQWWSCSTLLHLC